MSRLVRPLLVAAALVAGFATSPAHASSGQDAEVLSAIQRDLGLSAEQATARLAADKASSSTAADLRKRLADRFGGRGSTRPAPSRSPSPTRPPTPAPGWCSAASANWTR